MAITVNLPTFSLTATATTGGSITPTGVTNILSGGSQTYSITPQTGYHIVDVKVDGASQGVINSYSFPNVTANHTIDVLFAVNTYTITATTANTGGTITPAGSTVLNFGASQSYSITPDPGFVLVDIRVNYVSIGNSNPGYTFNSVSADQSIEVVFAPDGVIDQNNTTKTPQINEALLLMKHITGEGILTPEQFKRANIAPITNGVPQPDLNIDTGDLLVMLRRVVKLENW